MPEHLIQLEIIPSSESRREEVNKIVLEAVKGESSVAVNVDGRTAKTFLTSDDDQYLSSFWSNLRKQPELKSSYGRMTVIYRQIKTDSGEIKYLEPIMTIEIVVSTKGLDAKKSKEMIQDLMRDFKKYRGQLTSQESLENSEVLKGIAPLDTMWAIKGSRAFNAGRARYTMKYSHHEPIPDGDPGPFRTAAAMREA
jgi:hypothetical protein